VVALVDFPVFALRGPDVGNPAPVTYPVKALIEETLASQSGTHRFPPVKFTIQSSGVVLGDGDGARMCHPLWPRIIRCRKRKSGRGHCLPRPRHHEVFLRGYFEHGRRSPGGLSPDFFHCPLVRRAFFVFSEFRLCCWLLRFHALVARSSRCTPCARSCLLRFWTRQDAGPIAVQADRAAMARS